MNANRSLVLGGVKSGKSRYAMELATQCVSNNAACENVVFIATARPDDDEMEQRILRHQLDRPVHWRIIEEPRHVVACLQGLSNEKNTSVVLLDCLTLWLTQLCSEGLSANALGDECQRLVDQVADIEYPIVIVGNESNMGVTPLGEFSRRYCDAAGLLHQSLASVCDSVTLVVAGLPLTLKPS